MRRDHRNRHAPGPETRFRAIDSAGQVPVTALGRCAVALAANEVVGIEIGEVETSFEPDGAPGRPPLSSTLSRLIDAADAVRAG